MEKTIKLDLSAIGEGSLQEKVDKELEKSLTTFLILTPKANQRVS